MIVPAGGSDGGEDIAEDGREDTDERHEATSRLTTAVEQSEGEESEEGSVGVGGDGIDGIDDAGAVECSEGEDDKQHEDAHEDVGCATEALIFRTSEEIDADAGGEGCEGAVGTGQGCCHDAEGEEDEGALTQIAACTEHGQHLVGGLRLGDAVMTHEEVHEYAEAEEQQVEGQVEQSVDDHVLL